jgi:hypothetical protein
VALPSEARETMDFSNLPRDLGNSACIDMQGLSAPNPKQLPATAQRDDADGPFESRGFAGRNCQGVAPPTWSAQLIASLNFAALQAAYDEAYR